MAEWQRRREEEAALLARYAPSGPDGGSGDDEMPGDVRNWVGKVAQKT